MKKSAIKLLEDGCISVKDVVYELSDLPATEIDEHKFFLDEKLDKLRESKDQTALFSHLNLYWTYLSPHLLTHLVSQIPSLRKMEGAMETYMSKLHIFRTQTPLKLFCKLDKRHIIQPNGFSKVVVRFKQLKSKPYLTLQDLEDFRQKYGSYYSLTKIALMLQDEIEEMSFIVTFLVPQSVVELLQSSVPEQILREFKVTQLEISGQNIFCETQKQTASVKSSLEGATPDTTLSVEASVTDTICM